MLFLLLPAVFAEAHHSFAAEFDMEKPVHLKGILTRVDFSNPHTHFYLDVKNPGGGITSWEIEAASPNGLRLRGFTRSTVAPGTLVVINGYQSRTSANRAAARDIVLPNGYTILLGSFSDKVK